jgi:hypothetical protein
VSKIRLENSVLSSVADPSAYSRLRVEMSKTNWSLSDELTTDTSSAGINRQQPQFLKNASRIQGLLASYFFALLVQTLLERELRQAMARAGEVTLPLYPEARPSARPTTHRLIEVFSSIQRHEVPVGEGDPQVMLIKLTKTQRSIIRLLGLNPRTYGLAWPIVRPAGNCRDDLRKVS